MNNTILNLFSKIKDRNKNHIAFKYKKDKVWKKLNWNDYYRAVFHINAFLKSIQVGQDDCVCIIAKPSYKWTISDIGIMSNQSITVPIYKNSLDSDIEYIINNCEAKAIFCEDDALASKIKSLKCPSLEKIIVFDTKKESSFITFDDIISDDSTPNDDFESALKQTPATQTATIIYTSGTTGVPKGVVLTHKQLFSEVTDIFDCFDFDHTDTSLCFLPLAHVMGRIESLGNIYKPYTIAYAESVEAIKKNILTIKPTFLIAVPRIFEKIYNGVITQINSKKSTMQLFKWASSVGKKVSALKMNKKNIPLHLALQFKLADKLIYSKIQSAMGGNIRYALSGGAPLEKKISEFFHSANILILEAYGLTETTAGITANTPYNYKFGTVGKPLKDVKLKLAEDNEILVKSDKVMKEYYNMPEATENVFEDGYFRTGDIGHITEDGFLKITDRKKDLIKTAGGKYVAPQKLENLLKIEPTIANVLIHGDKKKYIVALITLDEASITQFAKKHGLSYSSVDSLADNNVVNEHVAGVIKEMNSQLAKYETVKKFKILHKDFTIETGELTPSMKVKRKFCDEKFKDVLNSLY